MFKQIIFSYNHYGQKHTGFKNTIQTLEKHINVNIKKDWVNCTGNLNDNLKNIYEKNTHVYGSRMNIGGDHSMAIATGSYSLNKFPNTKFIWIDAHPDINTYESSSTKNVHGMPLAFLTGIIKKHQYYFINNKLPFENLLYIGIRDIDNFERNIIENKKISTITSNECNNNIDETCKEISKFAKSSPLHVSFDIDSLESKLVPSTGTPVKNGLSKIAAKRILTHILNSHNVVNMDITELNLSLGSKKDKEVSLKNTLDIFNSLKIIKR